MDLTSQAVELLKTKYFKSYRVFPEDNEGMIDFEALSNTKPRWVEFKRVRIDQIQMIPNALDLKGVSIWDDAGQKIEKEFECLVELPVTLNSTVQFL